ncbi:C40 family peptidase [Phragmitibacter flavus]|uniref:C40 family peptidase n=1 Tax=Phragmitibacter flavus TaxID=2576071 RepID=UPI00197FF46A|nr:C40 family peptidase [Phragmitibacter flavus]
MKRSSSSSPIRWILASVVVWFLLQSLWLTKAQASGAYPFLSYNGKVAKAPVGVPPAVHHAVKAANSLQGKPYVFGGGHRKLYDRGYDCSGSVSYVLYHAGLLRGPMHSKAFKDYGRPGPGKFITLFVTDGHVFMSICGLRFDTSDWGAGRGEGPRWRPKSRKLASGYQMRHPPGL